MLRITYPADGAGASRRAAILSYVRAITAGLIFLWAAGPGLAQEADPLTCCLSLSTSCATVTAENCTPPDGVPVPGEVCCSLPLTREACVESENPACDTGQPGACADGVPSCDEDAGLVCDPKNEPAEETCNGVDDDCNGTVDDGFGIGEPCGSGIGACQPGTWQCAPDGDRICAGAGEPGVESCNGIDDDCNGVVDDGSASSECTSGDACLQGVCSNGACVAVPAADGTACTDGDPCTVTDVCAGGTCTGQSLDCNDGVSCTQDVCDPASGQCVTFPDDGQCPAGEVCQPGIGCECPDGETSCNGTCVDTQSDASHCGGCDNACPSGICSSGLCS